MDKKIANNLIVGITVLAGFAALVFLILNVDGGVSLFSSQNSLFGYFKQVKGLHYGSEVSLAGLRIGVVKEIAISKDDPKELVVELAISKDKFDRIREDSVATIKTQGVLGDKYIEISIGSPSAPALKPGARITSNEAEDIFTKGGDLVGDVKKQFGPGGDFEKTMRNLSAAAENLAVLTSDLRRTDAMGNFGKASSHLKDILRKVDDGEGTLGALVNDPSVYEDVKTVLGGAKRSSVLRYFMRSFMESGQEKKEKEEPKK